MARIIGKLRPFDLKQHFYVYEDGNKLADIMTTLEDLNDNILNLCEEYDVHQIDLTGPKQYNTGLAKRIQEAELAKYNKNTLTINII